MSSPLRVLVAGGGVAALETVLALDALAGNRVALELLAPAREFVERPSSVLSPFSGQPAPTVPLDRLSELGVRWHRGALAAVDPEAHRIRTTDGGELSYDRLVVAVGARPVDGLPGAVTFRGPLSAGAVEGALRGARERVVFALPPQSGWPLPLYELALLSARELPDGPDITIVTPEPRPLDIFGRTGSDALARLLDRAGVEFIGDTVAVEVVGGALATEDGRLLGADAVIAPAVLRAPSIEGLSPGFLPIDEHARVAGVPDIFAAGDATDQPFKQGGLATQQADAAAELIAAEAGARVTPQPFRRVLRAIVLTGEAPLYLRRDLEDDHGHVKELRGVSRAGLWWPSGKIAGRYLTGFLAAGGERGERLSDRPPKRPRVA